MNEPVCKSICTVSPSFPQCISCQCTIRPSEDDFLYSGQCYRLPFPDRGPQISRIRITWEPVRNAVSGSILAYNKFEKLVPGPEISVFTCPAGDSDATPKSENRRSVSN